MPANMGASAVRLGYQPALDGVRALAIVLVVLFNAHAPPVFSGYVGVWIFFVLSGFLITGLLLEPLASHGRAELGAFYLRRFTRLFPPLAAMLLAYAVFHLAVGGRAAIEPIAYDVLFAASYAANWTYTFLGSPQALGHTWSLAVEEQFYFLWPLLLALAWRMGRRRAVAWMLVLSLLALAAWRWLLVGQAIAGSATWTRVYCGTDTGATGFLLGAALAWWIAGPTAAGVLQSARARRWAPWAIVVALAVLAPLSRYLDTDVPFTYLVGLPLVELASALLIAALLVPGRHWPKRIFEWGVVVYVGRISYSWYLWHLPIVHYLKGIDRHWSFVAGIGLPLSFACAALSFHHIERRLLARSSRRGLEPRSQSA